MTSANRNRVTSDSPELGRFERVRVVQGDAPPSVSTVATSEAAVEYRWVEVRTAKSLGRVSVTVSPSEEARKRENRRFNRGAPGR